MWSHVIRGSENRRAHMFLCDLSSLVCSMYACSAFLRRQSTSFLRTSVGYVYMMLQPMRRSLLIKASEK